MSRARQPLKRLYRPKQERRKFFKRVVLKEERLIDASKDSVQNLDASIRHLLEASSAERSFPLFKTLLFLATEHEEKIKELKNNSDFKRKLEFFEDSKNFIPNSGKLFLRG